tara:strand:+ start:3099 stop:4940 length:1842 start_codon:yes stop_codon:yes gene_type:complete
VNEYVFDIEANGLNPDKIHCLVSNEQNSTSIDGMSYLVDVDRADLLIGHNIIQYDIPVLERILDIKVKAELVDTLALSWYLFPKRTKHGLESWGMDFGVPKPPIAEWDTLSPEEYLHRCKEDVKINTMLWELQKQYLIDIYGSLEEAMGLIRYLSFKMDCARLQEETKWKLDVPKAEALYILLNDRQDLAKTTLQSVMPKVKKYIKRSRPAKPYKIDRSLSATGIKWDALVKEHNLSFDYDREIEVFVKEVEPNASSHKQIKDWLFDLGWQPATYKFVREGDSERKIPQIKTQSGEMCESIERMVASNPELASLAELGVLGHRIGIVKGFLEAEEAGFVVAGIQGLTNTLRFKHRTCVNIPSSRKPYGSEIRALLTSRDGYELCGSDMCSLEDRTKQGYMWDYDPEYVKDMMVEGFDPHLDIAGQAGMMTEVDALKYKGGDKTDELSLIRYNAKTANYASTYGAGATTIARQAGMSLREAKKLHKAYWERNWSLKTIANNVETKVVQGISWLYNPVSKLWYYLKADKDKFSTLNQGTGTFLFDMWVKEIRERQPKIKLVGQFHDEVILEVRKGYNKQVTKLLKDSVAGVNNTYKLNRDLDVDVDFSDNYAGVH